MDELNKGYKLHLTISSPPSPQKKAINIVFSEEKKCRKIINL